uniref:PHP domain-containing protein n=1 Tax=candidate division WOR-3 bacterium TaxID=2052148 RepID=A0A7C4U654_UNCW3
MRIKADLHIHTRNSIDSLNSIEKIIQFGKNRKINLLGITDHNILTSFDCEENIRFIFGEEIKTKDGEIIGYFLKESIKKGMGLMDTIKAIREQNGIVCVPHPLDRLRRSAIGYDNLMKIIDYIDVIEVFNGRTTFIEDNISAMKIAKEFGKGLSAGSDAHIPFEIGVCYVEIEDFKDKDEFLNVLKKGDVKMGLSPFIVHIPSTFTKFYNKFRRTKEKNCI